MVYNSISRFLKAKNWVKSCYIFNILWFWISSAFRCSFIWVIGLFIDLFNIKHFYSKFIFFSYLFSSEKNPHKAKGKLEFKFSFNLVLASKQIKIVYKFNKYRIWKLLFKQIFINKGDKFKLTKILNFIQFEKCRIHSKNMDCKAHNIIE